MISILRHVRLGDFTLHSGDKSEVLFDVQSMLCDPKLRTEIVAELVEECKLRPSEFLDEWPRPVEGGRFRLVGIELGGALLAALIAEEICVPLVIYRPGKPLPPVVGVEQVERVAEARIVGELNEHDAVILIDDVVTKGNSMADARATIEARGVTVLKEICAVDRRELRS